MSEPAEPDIVDTEAVPTANDLGQAKPDPKLATRLRTFVWWPLRIINAIAGSGLVGLIRVYQTTLGRALGPKCRFHPTCSEYAVLAIQRYGVLIGIGKAVLRVGRCHPFHPGGFDPP